MSQGSLPLSYVLSPRPRLWNSKKATSMTPKATVSSRPMICSYQRVSHNLWPSMTTEGVMRWYPPQALIKAYWTFPHLPEMTFPPAKVPRTHDPPKVGICTLRCAFLLRTYGRNCNRLTLDIVQTKNGCFHVCGMMYLTCVYSGIYTVRTCIARAAIHSLRSDALQ